MCCTAGGGSFGMASATSFRGMENSGGRKDGSLSWSERWAADADWKSAVCQKVKEEMKADRGLAVVRMGELGGVSRASFSRFEETSTARVDRDMDLHDATQRIALERPRYGRPRITAELKRKVWKVGPNRVRRLMREDNLLCV